MSTRILIADDSRALRTALRQLLESSDQWEIIDVENGQEAVTKALEILPNVVILDFAMPVMNGLTAARELSKRAPQIPLLMHTLYSSPQVEVEARKVGIRKVIPKTDTKGLVDAVLELLPYHCPISHEAETQIGLPQVSIPPQTTQSTPVQSSATPAVIASPPGDPEKPGASDRTQEVAEPDEDKGDRRIAS